MALHRLLARVRLSRRLESAARSIGATRFLGSPVILIATEHDYPLGRSR